MNSRSIHFTGRLIPLSLYVPHAVTNETECLFKAIERWRISNNPESVALAREVAAQCDNHDLPIDDRVSLRKELTRIMNRIRSGSTELSERDAEVEFWIRIWDIYEELTPRDPLFSVYSRDDLVAEVLRDFDPDPDEEQDDDDSEDNIERSNNHAHN